MLQNLLVTALTTLKDENKISQWENKAFCGVWPEKNGKTGITKTIKKKPKRNRTAFTTEQLRTLERKYVENKYIDAMSRRELAKYLKIDEKCIKIWYQNRRMKEKRESSSSDSDSSSVNLDPHTPELVTYEQNTQAQNNNYYAHNHLDIVNDQIPNNSYDYQMPQYTEMQYYNMHPTAYYPNDCMSFSNENQYNGYNGFWQSNNYPGYYYNFN